VRVRRNASRFADLVVGNARLAVLCFEAPGKDFQLLWRVVVFDATNPNVRPQWSRDQAGSQREDGAKPPRRVVALRQLVDRRWRRPRRQFDHRRKTSLGEELLDRGDVANRQIERAHTDRPIHVPTGSHRDQRPTEKLAAFSRAGRSQQLDRIDEIETGGCGCRLQPPNKLQIDVHPATLDISHSNPDRARNYATDGTFRAHEP
jgi:hypothetical protein